MLLTKFSELAVGDEELAEGAQTLQGLVTVLLGGCLVKGGVRLLGVASGGLRALVDEVLDEIALILGQEKQLGLLDDVAQVGDENLALLGQLCGRLCKGARSQGAVHGNIYLLVLDKQDEQG